MQSFRNVRNEARKGLHVAERLVRNGFASRGRACVRKSFRGGAKRTRRGSSAQLGARVAAQTGPRTAFCTTRWWVRCTVMGSASTNREKCEATIATWMHCLSGLAGKGTRPSPARTRRSVVHGTAPHTGNRSARWFTPQGDSVKTHALLATRIPEDGQPSRRHRRRKKLLVARNGVPSLRCRRL